jgi:hypothetical protein
MKLLLATIIILTAVFALTVGSFAMVNMASGNHANCLAAIPGSPKCVGSMDPIQFAITHISTLLGASLGVVSPLVISLLALLAVFAWFVVPDISNLLLAVSAYPRIFAETSLSSIHKQRHWVSLLEKRDPSLPCAMNA